jgi:hypothetical protein
VVRLRPPTNVLRVEEKASPTRPRPAVSSVPRAKTTLMSEHGSAVADGATASIVAAQTRAEVIAANRADILIKVTQPIFT